MEQRFLDFSNLKIWWVMCYNFLLWAAALKQVKPKKIPSYCGVFM